MNVLKHTVPTSTELDSVCLNVTSGYKFDVY